VLDAEVVGGDGPAAECEEDVDRLRDDQQKSTGAYVTGEDQEGAGHRQEHRPQLQSPPPSRATGQHGPIIGHSGIGTQSPGHWVDRVSRENFSRWLAGAVSAGECVRPVRLRPALLRADPTTGELTPSAGELP